MAPSSTLRYSQGWECMGENGHKRCRSFESGLTFKSKDDDLALFNEMQNQEKDKFLLHTADDFEESISKLRHFSDFKLGISIPARGESDLLNVEGEKNDYDWLLTPPDTPLFPSLDDEYPQVVNPAARGRAGSQSITSRIAADKRHQTSSSPCRLSPSPRSNDTLTQMRGRTSSIPRSSPPPSIRSGTPTCRSSTPPNKQSSLTPRSSTPTVRRASTSSNIHLSNYRGRGTCPAKAGCVNPASPKVQGWQMTLPGFTFEAPPNLRTSLSDRSVSHTRCSSPASANGRVSSRKFGRKSMSPTSSSLSSSNGQERDCFSSYSKRSMVSSGDDEESLHSIKMGISRSSPARKDGALASNKAMSYTRKPSRYSTTNSVPKRSFVPALRLMDQHKTPQNMFRPLLSSVPATTIRPIFSRNSSLTTSSNASSEQGIFSIALDVEGSEVELTELPVRWERTEDSENHEDVFLFDKVDEIIEVTDHKVPSRKPQRHDDIYGEILLQKFDSEDTYNPTIHIGVETSNATLDKTGCTDKNCDMDDHIMITVCCKCNKEFTALDMNENINLCPECAEEDGICTTGNAVTCAPVAKNAAFLVEVGVDAAEKGLPNNEDPEFHKVGNVMGHDCMQNNPSIQLLGQRESELSNQYLDRKRDVHVPQNCSISAPHQSNHTFHPSLNVDIPEGTGILVLLSHNSGSSKWPVLQGKAVSATNILCSEPSYSRDNINSLRRSIGRDSASASSSVDLGSSRQKVNSIQFPLSREEETVHMRDDIDSNADSTSNSGDLLMNCYESERFETECKQTTTNSTKFFGCGTPREHVASFDQTNFNAMSTSFSRPVISDNYISEHTNSFMTIITSDSQILVNRGDNDLSCSSATEMICNKDSTSSIHIDEYSQNNGSNVRNIGGTDINDGCSEMEEDYTVLNCNSQNDNFDAATQSSSIVNVDFPCGCSELEECHPECILSHNPAYSVQYNGHSIPQTSENDLSLSASEPRTAGLEHGSHENSCVIIERRRGHLSRSLTLEEATDTILFCSSIIHELTYRAAAIGMEKELNLLSETQASDSAMTDLGKPITGLRESRRMSYKHTPRSHMFKPRRMEPQSKSPCNEVQNDMNAHEFTFSSVETPRKVDTAKPPKLDSKCNCTVM
ncbi:uncharacterized protein LOC110035613 [Phalaenopsis equestris]|uniref:uncharacterized protein LOC110035613 n=1 Tax=Phalaenopsis equestris TaxID=78828 RepID=UPI0009E59A6F|nr:uncharacterized protein LOC110035613 [Phalaenopsis equestris]XP_020595532.1 uncharacterized protein LOC110035613 [Phalaenopsis equestris]XP_020595533.1 uncharacterized protein LOC110035613 [Phalaenopsis equestris]